MARTQPASQLGEYLRGLRGRTGLTLRQVQDLSQSHPEPITFDYLCRAERGRLTPSPQKLLTLSHVYEVPAQSFLDKLDLAQFEAYSPASRDPEECRRLGVAEGEKGDYRKAYACFQKGLQLLDTAPVRDPAESAELVARMRNNLAITLLRLGKHRMAEQEIERVLERRERSNYITSRSLNVLSGIHYQLDRLELAEAAALAALRIARREGDSDQIRQSLINLANPRFDFGQFRSAATIYRRAIALRRAGENSQDITIALFNLGDCYHRLGDHCKAEDMYQEGLAMAERLGNPRLKARGLLHRGRSLFLGGKLEAARSNLMESRAIGMTHDYCLETFDSMYYLWRMAIGQKVGSEAAELFRALKKLRLRVDQRSEEVLSFDACLTEVRSRRRQKGA